MTTSGPSTSRKTFQREQHGTTLTLQVRGKKVKFSSHRANDLTLHQFTLVISAEALNAACVFQRP